MIKIKELQTCINVLKNNDMIDDHINVNNLYELFKHFEEKQLITENELLMIKKQVS